MKPIKILHMYADMLDLYGDSGNMEILQYRCKMRGIPCEIEHYSRTSEVPDFSSYDLIYLGGGADLEQQILSADLPRCSEGLKKAYADGVFFLMICGGYQLMGKYYRDADGNELPGVGLFDYHTIAPNSRRKRCIGNIVVQTEITGEPLDIIGFENHGGQTSGVTSPFGKVRCGNGNCFQSDTEGYCGKNVIATYLHGPLLAKNPKLSDYILTYCLSRREDAPEQLAPLDDTLENECRAVMLERLLKK
ncbi:MAG: glutamine amidotransferase [Ruminococcus sp.]|nr:glutamine amidotransferase [Ruminococcus sp.]